MAFQFLCPQGHLLEGDEAHMGMACQCPQCGMTFIIPTIQARAPAASEPDWAAEDYTSPPDAPFEQFAELQATTPQFENFAVEEPASQIDPPAAKAEKSAAKTEKPAVQDLLEEMDPRAGDVVSMGALEDAVLHIPCPNGHELEAPVEMIGHRVLCPHCSVQFRLHREDSIEYQQHQEILDRARARFWSRWALIIGILIGLGMLAMIIMAWTHSAA